MAAIINFFIILSFIIANEAQISKTELYDFGAKANDLTLAKQDDASSRIVINFDLPYFGTIYRELFISTNGILTFGAGITSYVPSRFPLHDTRAVATYWTDSDPSRGVGNIFYRQVYDQATLFKISEEIRSKFVGQVAFNSRWALIVTFANVPAFGCGQIHQCSSNCSQILNHQTILASDGSHTFVIFNFNQLDYTVGTANCYAHAQVGFNAGDGKRYYLVQSSNTNAIANVALLTSNVGKAGKWMFKIDGDDISSGCNMNGWLNIYPRRMLYFGQDSIEISGPCFEAKFVNVTIEQYTIICSLVDQVKAVCQAPFFTKLGRNRVAIINQNILYESFITITDTADHMISNLNIQFSEGNFEMPFEIFWEPSQITDEVITVRGFQEDYYFSDNFDIHKVIVTPTSYGTFTRKNGSAILPQYNPKVIINKAVIFHVRRISLIISEYKSVFIKYFEEEIPGPCDIWYNGQPSNILIKSILDSVSRRSPCPPSVPAEFPNELPNFALDDSCKPTNSGQIMCNFFHPGSKGCYRSTNNPDGHAAQCCYDFNNNLLLSIPGGGTLDMADSSSSARDHFWQDVVPYLLCCKFASKCAKYYEKRPIIDSKYFIPPRITRANGDPHFLTLDDVSYDFNAVGEFTYLESDSDIIQVRMSQFIKQNTFFNQPTQACYFSAFVFKSRSENSSTVIQVELNPLRMFTFRINGQVVNFEMGAYDFIGISINYFKNDTCIIYLHSGITAEIKQVSQMLHIILTVPNSLKGYIKGLIGYWDDNPSNDFILPNGTWIFINSSSYDIHYRFGLSWLTNNLTSLFTYPQKLSWTDYQNPYFIPNFAVPPINPICGNNQACAYDIMVTGNVEVGTSNIAIMERQQKLQTFYKNLVNVYVNESSSVSVYVTESSTNKDSVTQTSLSKKLQYGLWIYMLVSTCLYVY